MNIASLVDIKSNPNIPELTPGDTVKVSIRVVEGDKERTQVFSGVIIRLRHGGASASFTVRRVTYGVGVERTFPIYSPRVEKVEVVRHGKVRRAKLYYLRGLSAKASRIKERRLTPQELELEREREESLKAEQQLQAEAQASEPAPEAAQPQAAPEASKPAQPKAEAQTVESKPEIKPS
ncbi:MAG: 50S ribosomal protein L19 [Chloroflexi bacterium]|nr:50S ribosomal protein L19 [Chloroflexota bacterium]MBI2979454.1 50S ribosomal protein L19 [Chloroflexota bacterium]